MKNVKVQSDTYLDIKAGTKVIVPNPKWDGDIEHTQFNIEVELLSDVCVLLVGEDTIVKVIQRIE